MTVQNTLMMAANVRTLFLQSLQHHFTTDYSEENTDVFGFNQGVDIKAKSYNKPGSVNRDPSGGSSDRVTRLADV